MQETLIRKHIRLYVIDADRVAIEAGMPGRINTIMQTCFFAISGVLPRDEAIAKIKEAIETTCTDAREGTGREQFRGRRSHARQPARSRAAASSDQHARSSPSRARARAEFVRQVTAMMIAGRGNELPVSACRSMAPIRPRRPDGRSGTSPTSSRSGSRSCASSAATA